MAIPTGPAGRPGKKKPAPELVMEPRTVVQDFAELTRSSVRAEGGPVPQPQSPLPAAPSPRRNRNTDRIPSEIIARDFTLSPAVLGLTLTDFFDLLYQGQIGPDQITVEEFFRMRENHAWPDAFPAGDARALFTEDMCRRGQFVPVGWNTEGICFATCKPEAEQDELVKALDLLVRLPVTVYTATVEQVEHGIGWLYRRS